MPTESVSLTDESAHPVPAHTSRQQASAVVEGLRMAAKTRLERVDRILAKAQVLREEAVLLLEYAVEIAHVYAESEKSADMTSEGCKSEGRAPESFRW